MATTFHIQSFVQLSEPMRKLLTAQFAIVCRVHNVVPSVHALESWFTTQEPGKLIHCTPDNVDGAYIQVKTTPVAGKPHPQSTKDTSINFFLCAMGVPETARKHLSRDLDFVVSHSLNIPSSQIALRFQ